MLRNRGYQILLWCFVVFAIVGLQGCGKSKAATPPKPVTFAEAQKLKDTLVSVEGYLGLGNQVSVNKNGGQGHCTIQFYSDETRQGTPINIHINLGNAPNQMEMLPQNYTVRDLKIRGKDGRLVDYNQKVKVMGKTGLPLNIAWISVESIEQSAKG